jgi:hypothetical protein
MKHFLVKLISEISKVSVTSFSTEFLAEVRMRRRSWGGRQSIVVLVHLLALSCGAPTTLMPPLTSAEANLTLEGKTVSQSVLGGWSRPTTKPVFTGNRWSKFVVGHVGCLFADKFYGVGSTWHPNLDSYGTYYCIDCLCEESHDGTGDVYCTDVENNCPLLDCRLQYVPKEKCCRKCWEGMHRDNNGVFH